MTQEKTRSAAVTGRAQHWDPACYTRNAGFVAVLGAPVLDLLDPRPGERVLDLGCGEGALTARLAELGAQVVGVDASADQIAAAKARGLDARVMDGQDLTFEAAFDAVLSNAAMHWMPRAEDVIDGVWRALVPGGRFAAEMGGGANVATVREALATSLARRGVDAAAVMPWYFPTDVEYRTLLKEHGFTVASIALIPRPTPLPGDVRDWLETFTESFLSTVPAGERPALLDELAAALRPRLLGADGVWVLDYVRLRFLAHKPG
jgi:trans-aconitate methyltransferase